MASQLIFYTHPMSRGRISVRCSKRSDSPIVPSCLTSLWRGWASSDYGLAYAYATARVLRLADGPDEVHRNQIARLELRKYQGPESLNGGSADVLPRDASPEFRRRPVWIA